MERTVELRPAGAAPGTGAPLLGQEVTRAPAPPKPALWYIDAAIYELHVRAFCDSDGDGIGDFRGLAQRLDYLQDLGVTAIWLLPFYPSPLKDDGYDISDYMGVHPGYGTLADFKEFLKETKRRGLKVITELVINHTSDQHPWFQRARLAPKGSRWRDYYVWNDTPDKFKEARVIFGDFEPSNWTWDPAAKAYFWHRFYFHQPDLNYDNPAVRREIFRVVDFWLGMGVDGLRLDAVPYLFEREGTNCENLPETHAFLKELRSHVDKKFKNRMLLAEANQWPEEAAAYFGQGDECHMAFHFPIMPRMFMAVHMEDRFPIVDILRQTPDAPPSGQWALFLRNHDELTLEMVTDEERDYMYRVYAVEPQARINLGIRRRLAPLLGNNRRKIELMNGLLLSLPGTPVIYNGDEIGMGDNVYLGDRNGVRTPMQWSADRNAGFSRANPQKLYLPVIIDPEYHYEAVNADVQQNNPHSLLWWMKRLLDLRKKYRAFSRGSMEFLHSENRKVLAYVRTCENERVLVVANLSRFVQFAELDLSAYKGHVPMELFGRVNFPAVKETPYILTLGPHSFYWFLLKAPSQSAEAPAPASQWPVLDLNGDWKAVFDPPRRALEVALPAFLKSRRWFGGKAREIKGVKLVDGVPFGGAQMLLVQVEYMDGMPETYFIPLAVAEGERAAAVRQSRPGSVAAVVRSGSAERVLYDAMTEPEFCASLLEAIRRRRRLKGRNGDVVLSRTDAFNAAEGGNLAPSTIKGEQSNTTVLFGDRLVLKAFRRLEEGMNPDLEIGRFLTEKAHFPYTPPVAGAIEYRRGRREPITLGILWQYVANQGDAWNYTLDALGPYYERVLTHHSQIHMGPDIHKGPMTLASEQIPAEVVDLIGTYLETARLLGRRTAQMHAALSRVGDGVHFAPEPFTTLYQRSIYQSMRNLASQAFYLLRKHVKSGSAPVEAKAVLDREEEVQKRFRSVLERRMTGLRIRCHGDFHLGQILYTGRDFIIIDFEGEPTRSLRERRIKRSPLRDVAGMLRSFHYAAYTALYGRSSSQTMRAEDAQLLEPWAYFWYAWVSSAFLRSYLDSSKDSPILPKDRKEIEFFLDISVLEKAVHELNYELNNRPEWVRIPLKGIEHLLDAAAERPRVVEA